MEPDKNKDIIDQISDALRNQSYSYEEGAWERYKAFEKTRNRKKVMWPYLSGIAAALLLAFTLFIFNRNEAPLPNEQLANKRAYNPVQQEKDMPGRLSEVEATSKAEPNQSAGAGEYKGGSETVSTSALSDEPEEFVTKSFSIASTDDNSSVKESAVTVNAGNDATSGTRNTPERNTSIKETQPLAMQTPPTRNSYDDLYGASEQQGADNGFSSKKWDISLELAPNFKDDQINMGGGIAVSYNISEKLSITSGLSYVQIDAHRNPNSIDIPAEFTKTSLSNYNYSKSLSSINTSLSGLDIPVNLRFKLNESVYASAGVSVFSVLNESRYNNFEEHITELSYTSQEGTDKLVPEMSIRTVHTQEESLDAPYQGKNFTGFFNFSVGYHLPVFPKLNLSVEPYLKVPIGSLSTQDMDLSNGGLKIITSF